MRGGNAHTMKRTTPVLAFVARNCQLFSLESCTLSKNPKSVWTIPLKVAVSPEGSPHREGGESDTF